MTWTAATAKTTTAPCSGDTIGITLATAGGAYIDQASLMKWVDASVKNGCDDADGAALERLAGHKDVRGTAHALVTAGGGCVSITTTTRTASAFVGQGRKACQTNGGTYTDPTAFSVGFAYADLKMDGSVGSTIKKTDGSVGSTIAQSPKTATWRLCMVRVIAE